MNKPYLSLNLSNGTRIFTRPPIMSHTTSKILCRVDAKTIHGILSLPDNFPDNCESLNDQVLIELYRNCRTKFRCQFLSSILKDGQLLEFLFLPYNVNIFKKEV